MIGGREPEFNTMTAEEPTQVVAIGTGEYVELMSARRELQRI